MPSSHPVCFLLFHTSTGLPRSCITPPQLDTSLPGVVTSGQQPRQTSLEGAGSGQDGELTVVARMVSQFSGEVDGQAPNQEDARPQRPWSSGSARRTSVSFALPGGDEPQPLRLRAHSRLAAGLAAGLAAAQSAPVTPTGAGPRRTASPFEAAAATVPGEVEGQAQAAPPVLTVGRLCSGRLQVEGSAVSRQLSLRMGPALARLRGMGVGPSGA